MFRERLKTGNLWERVGGEKYKSMSVDAVVTSLLTQTRGRSGFASPSYLDSRSTGASLSSMSSSSMGFGMARNHLQALASVLEEDTPVTTPFTPVLSARTAFTPFTSVGAEDSSPMTLVVHPPPLPPLKGGQYGSFAPNDGPSS